MKPFFSMVTFLSCCLCLHAEGRGAESVCLDNPAIVFCEDFESGSLALWQDGVDASRQTLASVEENVFAGRASLEVTYPAGADGGWMTRWFMPGYERVFARLHLKLQQPWQCGANCTKIMALYGNRVDDRWSGFGKAGVRPTGGDYFYAGLVTSNGNRQPDPGEVVFYTYHPDMRRAPDGSYWGNFSYQNDPRDALQPGRWYCLEFEVKANGIGRSDGYQRMWIGGTFKGEVFNLRWRETPDLRINAFQLTFSGAVPVTQRLWVDNVVVSTERIGCSGDGSEGAPPAAPANLHAG